DPAAANAAANSALERVPRAVDEIEAVAYWSAGESAIVARSHLPGEAVLLPLGEPPTDLAVGFDGVLYVATAEGIRMHDLRGRWEDVTVTAEGFVPWRLAPDPRGGVWALERATGLVARLTGRPLTVRPFFEYAGTTFRPDPENCRPPALLVAPAPGAPAGGRLLATARPVGRGLALLSWADEAAVARRGVWAGRPGGLGAPWPLLGAGYAYAAEPAGGATSGGSGRGRVDATAFARGS